MSKRKTVDMKSLLDTVNERNEKSTCSADVRQGWNSLLESVLHDSGNYEGFGYLSADKVPEGHEPGIVVDGNTEYEGKPGTCPHVFPDETRRVYYYSHRVRNKV